MASETNQIVTKRWYRWLVRTLLLVIVAPVLVFVVWRVHLAFSVKARLAALQRAGHPITLVELERLRYAPIGGETNAAVFFNKGIALSHFTNSTSRKLLEEFPPYRILTSTQFFSGRYQEKLTQLLNENREAIDWLHNSPPGSQSRYALDTHLGYFRPLPRLKPLTTAVQLLSMQATQHADQNQMDAAMADLEAAFRILDSLADEPILISHLARMKFRKAIYDGVELILARRLFTEEQLVELSSAFHQREFPGSLTRALEGELCSGNRLFQLPMRELLAEAGANGDQASGPFAEKARIFLANIELNWSGLNPRDFNSFLGIMSEHLALTKIPFPERLHLEEELSRRTKESLLYSTHGFLAKEAYLIEAEDLACSGIIQTVLAVERFRLAHQNQLPDGLEELTPLLLSKGPMDPFSGMKLKYKKLPSGYVVYSIGRNRKDDGGIGETYGKRGDPDDIAFTVER
jgi:hypothetical protein